MSDAYGEDDFSRLGGDEDGYEEEEDENSKPSVGLAPSPQAARNFSEAPTVSRFEGSLVPLPSCLMSVEETGLAISSSV